MWDQGGQQPWPQWPLSQQQWMQSFQHQQDPGQVDWAALAQAWIAQKECTGAEPQSLQPNGQDIPGLEPTTQNSHGNFQSETSFGRVWQPEWGISGQPPPPPPPDQTWIPPGSGPMDVVNPSEDSNSQDSGEFTSEARHGVYPQNSHGMVLHQLLAQHLQAFLPLIGRDLYRIGGKADHLGLETDPAPLSNFLSNRKPQQH
ncbi:arginine/serine-rich protein PNISR isoform X2 [Thalassophryne amazonica]|uniref:arginine/serine-rich protein PNISR isoform X2 n=1 Tax=Thalassophryne amazonica TaxID=390379 RepID=UPI001471CC89|nr:arginine/serine-rich protein PNISR isoform X2 [Thalassophryne amazonica]